MTDQETEQPTEQPTDPRTDARHPAEEPDVEHVAADDAVIGVAFRWSIVVLVGIAVIAAGTWWLRRERTPLPVVVDDRPVVAPPILTVEASERPVVRFRDVTAAAGIDFVHESGARGEKLLPETMGSGCAFFDSDDDGDQDLLLVNADQWPHAASGARPPTMALFRNDGTGAFEDVTAAAGLAVPLYGTGVAIADVDGDDDRDLFVACLGRNRFFRHEGTDASTGVPTYVEATDAAGLAGGADDWSTSAGFFDCDGDGDLDLFVCNYVQWSREVDLGLDFTLNGSDRAYGPPKLYRGSFCSLFRNDGRGTFTDVSQAAGIHVANRATGEPMGKALAVTFVDVDHDGDFDVLVANDTVQNFAFRNEGDGTFAEIGSESGLAFDAMGSATGAMGMDAGDYADDGRLALGIANFANESTSFFVQQERNPWQFADMASAEGIGSHSRLKLSFGLFFFDYDLDGRLDLLQANGHLEDEINAFQPSQHYRQPAQLFWNRGSAGAARFAAVPEDDAGDFSRPIVGRGAAYADIDGDGDLDVVLTQTGGPPLLLRNEQDLGRHHVRLRLVGRAPNTDAIGALVEVTAGDTTRRRRVMPTRSYLSQVELPVTVGLGDATSVDRVRITWPDGAVQDLDDITIDDELVVRQPAED